MIGRFAILLLLLILFVSCKISQEYTFKSDFSGSFKMTFDLSGLNELEGVDEPDADEDYFEGLNIDSVKHYFNNLKGIRKTKVSTKENRLYLSYKFDDLEALNASLSADGGNLGVGDASHFSYENGVFSYQYSTAQMNDSIAEALQYFDFDVVMKFANRITSHDNGELLENGKGIFMQGNLGEVAKGEKSLNLNLKFD